MTDSVAQLAEIRTVLRAQAIQDALRGMSRRLVEGLDEKTRAALAPQILEKGPLQERFEEMHDAMRADLDQWLEGMGSDDILQSLLDTERAAHDVYRAMLDDIRDPRLLETLVGLLREEARHVAAVEQARRGRA